MTRGFQGTLCLGILLSAGAAWAQPQGNGQQKCINKMNKDTIKVEAAQGKLGSGCVKDFVKTGSSAETCMNSDVKMKVSDKVAKMSDDQGKDCLSPLPDFAYTGTGTASAAAVQAGKDILHDAFGNPLDAGLFSCDSHPADCLCQRQAIDRVVKIFNATNKIFVKCKKAALAIGHDPFPTGAASPSDIADCVTNASTTNGLSVESDPKGGIAKASGQLTATLSHFCTPAPDDPFVDGKCAGAGNSAAQTTCLDERVRCRFCQMVNAADALSIDCSTWSGTTCP